MISLFEYLQNSILLEGYDRVWDATTKFKEFEVPKDISEDKYIEQVCNLAQIDRHDKKYSKFVELIRAAYKVWSTDFQLAKPNIPFRFDTTKPKNIKLARCYDDYKLLGGSAKKSKYADVSVEIGNGLGGGQNGYKFEKDVVSALCAYMVNGCSTEGLNLPQPQMDMLKHVGDSELKDLLSEAYKYYISMGGESNKDVNPDTLVSTMAKVIYQTGESANKRGIDNILVDSDGEAAREESGKIISDINLHTSDTNVLYISVKDSQAQLSGVIVSPSRSKIFQESTKWMEAILDQNVAYNEIDEQYSKHKEAFENFWKMLGVEPESIYESWQASKSDKSNIPPLRLMTSGYNATECGNVIQNIIGGNYWYVSPKKCLFIPYQSRGWKFIPTKAHMTPKGVCVDGELAGVPMKVWVRSSSAKSTVPNRMFPVVNVDELFKTIGKDI